MILNKVVEKSIYLCIYLCIFVIIFQDGGKDFQILISLLRGLDNLFSPQERLSTQSCSLRNDSESDDSDAEHEKSLKRRIPTEQQQGNKQSRQELNEDIALRNLLSGLKENNETMVDEESEKEDEENSIVTEAGAEEDENKDPNEDFNDNADDYDETNVNVEDIPIKLSNVVDVCLKNPSTSKNNKKIPREASKQQSYNKSPPDSHMSANLNKSVRRY